MIKVLYQDLQLFTTNNGNVSESFTPKKGLLQGNPVASYLFLIMIERLAIQLRKNDKIKGIKIGSEEVLLSMFADDLAMILEYDQQCFNEVVLSVNQD